MNNLNVMNAALFAMLLVVAGYNFPSFFSVQSKYVLPSPAKSVVTEEKTVEPQPLSPSEYSVIADQNVFHPERTIPVLKPVAPPLPVPEFVLYGTLIAGDVSLAYMEDLKGVTSSGMGKRQKALKKGQILSGFTLKEIDTDKVVMLRGEEKLEVRVTDKARTKHAEPAAAPAAPGQGPAAAAAPRQVSPARSVSSPGQHSARAGSGDSKSQLLEARRAMKSLRNQQQNTVGQ